jgi:hypothetical protein
MSDSFTRLIVVAVLVAAVWFFWPSIVNYVSDLRGHLGGRPYDERPVYADPAPPSVDPGLLSRRDGDCDCEARPRERCGPPPEIYGRGWPEGETYDGRGRVDEGITPSAEEMPGRGYGRVRETLTPPRDGRPYQWRQCRSGPRGGTPRCDPWQDGPEPEDRSWGGRW